MGLQNLTKLVRVQPCSPIYIRSKLWQDFNVLIVKKNLKRIGLNGFLQHFSIGLVKGILAVLIVMGDRI